MGMYTDWFLAQPDEAAEIAMSDDPFHRWPCLSLKSVLDLELQRLWSILLDRRFSAALQIADQLLYGEEDSEEGPFVFEVAPDFVGLLAEVPDARTGEIAKKWAKIAEFKGRMDQADVAAALDELIGFAREARRKNLSILQLVVL